MFQRKSIIKKIIRNSITFFIDLDKKIKKIYKYQFFKGKFKVWIYFSINLISKLIRNKSYINYVPPILFTSYCCENNDTLLTKILDKWSYLNPEFKIKYFSDKDLDLFFKKHKAYLSTFDKLKNGVAKADFFRLVYLNEYGGYWFDLDLEPFKIKRPNKGKVHLFDLGFKNISYMFIGGTQNKLFYEVIKKVMLNIDENFPHKKSHIIEITGPRVIQQIVSKKLGINLIDGEFEGSLVNKTFLKNTEYEFEYMFQGHFKLKSNLYKELQKKFNKKDYQDYNFI